MLPNASQCLPSSNPKQILSSLHEVIRESPKSQRPRNGSLAQVAAASPVSAKAKIADPLVMMFPPVGWQHTNMGAALYRENEAFRRAMHECEELCKDELPLPLTSVIYPSSEADDAACNEQLQRPIYTMPALFAVELSLYSAFVAKGGKRPSAVIGHSIGEYVAAVAAGVLDVPTAMALVCERGRAMEASMPLPSPGPRRARTALTQALLKLAGTENGFNCVSWPILAVPVSFRVF